MDDDIFGFMTGNPDSPPKLTLYDRLKIATITAKVELSRKTAPPTVLEIIGEENASIVVKEDKAEDGESHLIIYRNADSKNSPMIRVTNDRYQSVYFADLKDCRVFVMTKLIRVLFRNCHSCQISLRRPVICMAEFYKCRETNLSIRIPESIDNSSVIPITRIEDCVNFNIYQSNSDLVYVVKLCTSVTGTIVDPDTNARKKSYSLGRLFWSENEQNLICLSRNEGFGTIPVNYDLNNVSQILFIDEQNLDGPDLPFGTTPPVAKN